MRRKKASFIDLLEYYFDTYLPVAKGLSENAFCGGGRPLMRFRAAALRCRTAAHF